MLRPPVRCLPVLAGTILSIAVAAPSASALSLSASPVTLSLQPGATATGVGTIIASTLNANWTLQAEDSGTGQGHMITSCGKGDATLAKPLQLQATGLLTGATSAGVVSLSGANQTVASATNALLSNTTLTITYSQPIPSTEVLSVGCSYGITVTFTLQ
jgi:hypothetical protein